MDYMRTMNGDEIKPNLMVFTYDFKWGKVNAEGFKAVTDRVQWLLDHGYEPMKDEYWFEVNYPAGSNLYNGERMTTMCPRCHGDFEACDNSGCGDTKSKGWTGWN